MLEARNFYTATPLLDGTVLVAGGVGADTSDFFVNILASAELYDPTTGQWTATGAMLETRIYHTATLLPGGTVLVAGGANGVVDPFPIVTAERYDPVTGSWTATASMGEARSSYTATLLGDGTVLVAGGNGSSGYLASAELYDPGSGT